MESKTMKRSNEVKDNEIRAAVTAIRNRIAQETETPVYL